MTREKADGPLFGQVSSELIARHFFSVGLLNIVIAVVVTLPVLVPQLGLPLKLEVWPGTWMFISYFVFLIAGVLGCFVWCFVYYMLPRMYQKDTVGEFLALSQLVSYEVAVFALCAFMGIDAGYYGGTLYHNGFGPVVITQLIAWAVIPIGTLVVVTLLSTVTGVVNIITATNERVSSSGNTPMRYLVLLGLAVLIAVVIGTEIFLVVGKY